MPSHHAKLDFSFFFFLRHVLISGTLLNIHRLPIGTEPPALIGVDILSENLVPCIFVLKQDK